MEKLIKYKKKTVVQNVLSSWRQRQLLFCGRALIINALAMSRVWYVASLVHMAAWVLNELNTLVFNFFWKGEGDLVSRSVVVQPTVFFWFFCRQCKIQSFFPSRTVDQTLCQFSVQLGLIYVVLVSAGFWRYASSGVFSSASFFA